MKIICMSFDGEYQTERPSFKTAADAWNYSEDLGSKWYFYPFHFVVTESGKTILAAGYGLEWTAGLRTKTVQKAFEQFSKTDEARGVDAGTFAYNITETLEANGYEFTEDGKISQILKGGTRS